jgi:hypothetical protein
MPTPTLSSPTSEEAGDLRPRESVSASLPPWLPAPGRLSLFAPRRSPEGLDPVRVSSRFARKPCRAGASTSRNPLLPLRLPGSLLLRFAPRKFAASSLFQLPPRLTRFEPFWTVPKLCNHYHFGNPIDSVRPSLESTRQSASAKIFLLNPRASATSVNPMSASTRRDSSLSSNTPCSRHCS